ncbi:hypothetical protein [Burkholderia phage vB_BglM_WTB]
MISIRLICREYKGCIDSVSSDDAAHLIEFIWTTWGGAQTKGKPVPASLADLVSAWEGLRRDTYLEYDDSELERRLKVRQMRALMRECGIFELVTSSDKAHEIDLAVEKFIRSN